MPVEVVIGIFWTMSAVAASLMINDVVSALMSICAQLKRMNDLTESGIDTEAPPS